MYLQITYPFQNPDFFSGLLDDINKVYEREKERRGL
jgi:hypothetical protein